MAVEFDLIAQFFEPLSSGLSGQEIGIGDDGAVLSVPENHQLVVVTDTLVCGVHFPLETQPYDIAWKALAVNLSDLAAMGARPGAYSLALTLPEYDQAWLESFAQGLTDLSERFKIPLIGGDTTKGPLTVTVTAQGWVPNQQAILRSGAQIDDLIVVTGVVGDGALGLKLALNQLDNDALSTLSESEKRFLLAALNRPLPQLDIGCELHGIVNSGIDISDGLLADLGHILSQSSQKSGSDLGAEIELTQLPLSSGLQQYIQFSGDWTLPLSGGDDYQLCLTLPKERLAQLERQGKRFGVPVTVIGRIRSKPGIQCLQAGHDVSNECMKATGYSHF